MEIIRDYADFRAWLISYINSDFSGEILSNDVSSTRTQNWDKNDEKTILYYIFDNTTSDIFASIFVYRRHSCVRFYFTQQIYLIDFLADYFRFHISELGPPLLAVGLFSPPDYRLCLNTFFKKSLLNSVLYNFKVFQFSFFKKKLWIT